MCSHTIGCCFCTACSASAVICATVASLLLSYASSPVWRMTSGFCAVPALLARVVKLTGCEKPPDASPTT
jgi:hypothetical protein